MAVTGSCSYITVSQSPASQPHPVLKADTSACLVPGRMHCTGPEPGHRQICLHTGAGAPLTPSEPPKCPYDKGLSLHSHLSEARLGERSTRAPSSPGRNTGGRTFKCGSHLHVFRASCECWRPVPSVDIGGCCPNSRPLGSLRDGPSGVPALC